MYASLTDPGATAKKFVFDQPESGGSRFVKFLVKHVFRLGKRYEKLALSGPRFDRAKMIHTSPKSGHGVSVEKRQLGQCDYHLLRAGSKASDKVVYYLHGGGFVEGPAIGHCRFVREICRHTQTDVILFDYPKAPEHSHEQTRAAVHEMYQKLCAQYGAQNTIVMGDSAGGAFALALAHLLRRNGEELPARLILLSPSLDIRFENEDMRAVEPDDPLLTIKSIRAMRDAYLSCGGDPKSPLVSPLFGDLNGLPPIYVFMGTHDILLPDAQRLFEKAKAENARLEYYEFPRMMHVWMLFSFSEARAARQRIYELIRQPVSA